MIRNLLLAASFGFLGLTGIGCGNSTTPSTVKTTTKESTDKTTKETVKTEVTKVVDPIVKVPDAEAIKKEAEEAKKKLEAEMKKAVDDSTTEIKAALDPIEKQMKDVEGKLAGATGAEKDKLKKLVDEAKPIKENIVAKIKSLGEVKDLANLPKLKDEILKLVGELKAKLDTVK